MDYPRVTSMISMDGLGDTEAAFSVIKSCIKQIYDADNFYDAVDMDKTELDEFVGSMTHQQFEKVQEFFATMPKVKKLLKLFHMSLEGYYKTNFALMQHHKYSLNEIEDMIPWEREIYTAMLINYIEQENMKSRHNKNK